jgi:putative SOS response-associated peptidase YedK
MLTVEPGPDVEPCHDRQIVVLRPEDWGHWIYLTRLQNELLRPLPRGSLAVETARPGSEWLGRSLIDHC